MVCSVAFPPQSGLNPLPRAGQELFSQWGSSQTQLPGWVGGRPLGWESSSCSLRESHHGASVEQLSCPPSTLTFAWMIPFTLPLRRERIPAWEGGHFSTFYQKEGRENKSLERAGWTKGVSERLPPSSHTIPAHLPVTYGVILTGGALGKEAYEGAKAPKELTASLLLGVPL